MLYEEYNRASNRHLKTCQLLCGLLNKSKTHNEKQDIISNIYYLSGYVIECVVKYAIYRMVKFDPHKDVKDLDNPMYVKNYQMSYSKLIKGAKYHIMDDHKFLKFEAFFYKWKRYDLLSGSSEEKFKNWIKEWNVNFRYQSWECTENEIKIYVKFIDLIRNELLRKLK